MNWYTAMKKLAFPYGRVACPNKKCRKMFANDFGFKDVSGTGNTAGNTSTQEQGGLPFVDYEKKQHEQGADEVERGTITAQCPHCKQWMEVEYEWDTASPQAAGNDFFSQVNITDIMPITEEMARLYKGVGMSDAFTIPDAEMPNTDRLEDPAEQMTVPF